MNRLIINADDFGMNENCTKAIVECFKKSWITSTTAMVNMPYSQQGATVAKREGLIDGIGFHLNLYSGTPLTEEIKNCPLFCSSDGLFNHRFSIGLRRSWLPLDEHHKSALREELNAQIDRYFDLGYRVLHADSHHHMHVVYNVIKIVCETLSARGFKSIRRPVNMKLRPSLKSKIYYPLLDLVFLNALRKHGLISTDWIGSFGGLRECQDKESLNGVVELMVHPMYMRDGALNIEGDISDSGLYKMTEVVNRVLSSKEEFKSISFLQYISERI